MRCSLFSTKAWLATLILGFCGTGTGPLRAAEKAPVGPEVYHLMMRAVNARGTWNAVFPGFSADIKVNYKVQVLPNGKIKFTGVSEPHGRAWGWAHHWLSEIIFHRMGAQKSDAQYRSIRMIGGKNNPLAHCCQWMTRLIRVFASRERLSGRATAICLSRDRSMVDRDVYTSTS